jgi:hypothetical protein
MSDMPGLYCHRCETINPLGGVYGVDNKTYCEPCYIVMRRRVRKGLEPDAKELLG